jgi:hypothetical protein
MYIIFPKSDGLRREREARSWLFSGIGSSLKERYPKSLNSIIVFLVIYSKFESAMVESQELRVASQSVGHQAARTKENHGSCLKRAHLSGGS